MHLIFCLSYVLLGTHKKPFLTSDDKGRDPAWFSVPCREKTQDLALALMMPRQLKDRPTELACKQKYLAFQKEKQRVVRTLITFGRY